MAREQEPAHWAHVYDTHLNPHPQYRLAATPITSADILDGTIVAADVATTLRLSIVAANLAAVVAQTPAAGTMAYATSEDLWLYYTGSVWKLRGEQVIARQLLGSATSTLTASLPSIPNGRQLRVVVQGLMSVAGTAQMNFNGDFANNYGRLLINATNGTVSAAGLNALNQGYFEYTTVGATAAGWNSHEILIPEYQNSVAKQMLSRAFDPASLTNATLNSYTGYGRWTGTAAITSITITSGSGNWQIGSSITVYGSC